MNKAKLFGAVMAMVTTYIIAIVLNIWFWGSAVTSGIKAVSGSCGQEYGIEGTLISGDWFCPSKE